MELLNIVDLIEKNPITKLSNTYNNKLLQKIKESFIDTEQQLFIASFYCYLNYNDTTDFVIDLDNIWKWLDFSQKIRAKELLEKFFIKDKDYKILNDENIKNKRGSGGHNKEKIVLNIDTFKSFCMLAGTCKAKEIRTYFIKLERILQVLLDESNNEIREQFEKQNLQIQQLENNNAKLAKDKELEKHNLLLKEYESAGTLIYIVRVKTFDNGTYAIKIGESRIGIGNRYTEHKANYEECVFLDCFRVNRSKDFESFLHHHEKIRPSICKTLKDHENENELFLIGHKLSYATLCNIIEKNIKSYNTNNIEQEIEKFKLESETLKLLKELNNKTPDYITDMINLIKQLTNKVANLETNNKEILEKLNSLQTKTTNNFNIPLANVGPRLQKINPESLKLVKTYENIAEAIKEDHSLKRSSIGKAIKGNTIYNGFRWIFVDRELDPNNIHDLPPTVQVKLQNNGYIAKLNKEKTEIINVYLDRKVAAKSNGYESHSALDNPVKNCTLARGYYFILYNSCLEQLRKDFEKKIKGKPILYKNGVGKYNDKNVLLIEYTCKFDCARANGMGDRSLNKSLENNIAYNGYFYKYMEEKTKCFE